MARKRRRHKQNLGPDQIQRIQTGSTLSDFVKVEFEIAGAIFNEANLTSELLQLLQNVRLVERSAHEKHWHEGKRLKQKKDVRGSEMGFLMADVLEDGCILDKNH